MGLFTKRIYADTAATTPIDRRVLAILWSHLKNSFGNASSLYLEGVKADRLLQMARREVATVLSAQPDEIIFTSGGTESNVLALRGAYEAFKQATGHDGEIIVSATEHQSILEAAKSCERLGAKVIVLPVDQQGFVDPKSLEEVLSDKTVIVSIAYANNEIGTIAEVSGIAKVLRHWRKQNGDSQYPYFHTDACQAPRFLPLKVEALGVDLLTLNGSKIYGPKGVGVLYVRRGKHLIPILPGGGQEFGLRSGTQNVPAIIGLAQVLRLADRLREKEVFRLSNLRDQLMTLIKESVPEAVFYGPTGDKRLANNINVGWPGIEAEEVVIGLDVLGVAVSTGSACSSKAKPESHVLKALGVGDKMTSVRITLDRDASPKDILRIVNSLKKVIERIKISQNLVA